MCNRGQTFRMATIYDGTCQHCGKVYRGTGKSFCSSLCRTQASRNLIQRECKHCGKPFLFAPSRLKFGNPGYCSRVCWGKDAREKHLLREAPRPVQACGVCGKVFESPKPSRTTSKYCSMTCARKGQAIIRGRARYQPERHLSKICLQCGGEFTMPAAWFEKDPEHAGRFCSRNCSGAYNIRLQGGKRSSIEVAVEQVLGILGEEYEAQKSLGPWLVDFYLPGRNLVIECDGTYWHSLPRVREKDVRKESWLRRNGYNLARITEEHIRESAWAAVVGGLSVCRLATSEREWGDNGGP